MRFRRSGWLCNRLSLCEKDTFLHSELQWSWGEVSVFVLSCHSKFQLLLFVRHPGHYHQVGVKVKPIWQFALFRRKTECQNVTIRIWNNRPWNYACEQLARCGSHSRQLTCYKRLGATPNQLSARTPSWQIRRMNGFPSKRFQVPSPEAGSLWTPSVWHQTSTNLVRANHPPKMQWNWHQCL